ncbi:hypothetical protein ECANGB1_1377 [Enterospora canceri]|uniref:Uncharacterized protein n=1 Tax=Enterospora canceri TaxID=1081671 RepID=A0A1Y1S4M0_9MICR|nr:hypothetical protein ECANGB1_1377 [Enterospora canceri]
MSQKHLLVLPTILGQCNYLREYSVDDAIMVYLDDLIYKDSLLNDIKFNIKEYIRTKNKTVILALKKNQNGNKTVLISKGGHYTISKADLEQHLKNISGIDSVDLALEDVERINSVEEMNNLKTCSMIMCTFLEELIEKRILLRIKDGALVKENVDPTSYIQYLYVINEMNGRIHVAEHNYTTIRKFLEM